MKLYVFTSEDLDCEIRAITGDPDISERLKQLHPGWWFQVWDTNDLDIVPDPNPGFCVYQVRVVDPAFGIETDLKDVALADYENAGKTIPIENPSGMIFFLWARNPEGALEAAKALYQTGEKHK